MSWILRPPVDLSLALSKGEYPKKRSSDMLTLEKRIYIYFFSKKVEKALFFSSRGKHFFFACCLVNCVADLFACNSRNPSLSADGTWTSEYWPQHSPIKREVLELNANYSRVIDGLRVKKCAFWKKFLPRLLALGKKGQKQKKNKGKKKTRYFDNKE